MVSQLIYRVIISSTLEGGQECLLAAGIADDASSVAIIMIYSQVAWALLLDWAVWHSKVNTLSLVSLLFLLPKSGDGSERLNTMFYCMKQVMKTLQSVEK
ncbi:integral membrane protein DUF6 [Colletotrichum graminicola]|nr:integral membrane protein DUF6 [Colletotrichum graminicola]